MEEIINNKKYTFCVFKGIVLDSSKDSRTHVYGGYRTQYSYTPVSSFVSVHDIMFLKDKNGQEHEIHVTNWDIGAREGQELLFVWAVRQGSNSGPYLCIKNLSTGMTYTDKNEIKNMSRYSYGLLNLIITLPILALIILLWLISIYYTVHSPWLSRDFSTIMSCCMVVFVITGAIGLWISYIVQKTTYNRKVYQKIIDTINTMLNNVF